MLHNDVAREACVSQVPYKGSFHYRKDIASLSVPCGNFVTLISMVWSSIIQKLKKLDPQSYEWKSQYFNEPHWKLRQSGKFVGVTVRSVWDTQCDSGTLKSRWQNVSWETVVCIWVIQIYRKRKSCLKFGHVVLQNILMKMGKDHHTYVVHTAEHITRNGRQKTYDFEWNYVFLAPGKRQSSKVKNALILKLYHYIITQSLMAILWTLSFAQFLSVKETYFGNYFYFRNQVVRKGINFFCGWLTDIKPFLYNIIQ
jgi:hypothetical protein